VSRFTRDGCLVEIEAIAVKPEEAAR
jgi:hypothetical protein